jgi:hypothetical protein
MTKITNPGNFFRFVSETAQLRKQSQKPQRVCDVTKNTPVAKNTPLPVAKNTPRFPFEQKPTFLAKNYTFQESQLTITTIKCLY